MNDVPVEQIRQHLAAIETLLHEIETERSPRMRAAAMYPTARTLLVDCSRAWGVSVETLLTPCRRHPALWYRQAAAILLRERCGMSYKSIGFVLGQDHSTAVHSVRQAGCPQVAHLVSEMDTT